MSVFAKSTKRTRARRANPTETKKINPSKDILSVSEVSPLRRILLPRTNNCHETIENRMHVTA
jgi:hypothetical protein